MKTLVLRNKDVIRIVMGIPTNHQHIRTIMIAEDERFILQEATVANIVRAFITLKIHPTIHGVELVNKRCDSRKEGYSNYQLPESDTLPKEVISENDQIMEDLSC